MGAAQVISVVLSASATVLGALGSLLWWTYRRGQASGAEKARHEADQLAQAQADAKIQALERRVTEMQAELASRQPKRRRLLKLSLLRVRDIVVWMSRE
jgi:Flp pilus assembly protein TadB